ncbi:hypothetical protein [Bacillus sp. V33-4]|uniref:hypothetical protein n=1 Tax=Bacillus sp. V33-4 TaxID=2054169 RepID=UPI0021551CB2|nr:hypothetical protein [Bacillus sp. V33-4]
MLVQGTLNATDVRRHWSQFNDDIVREGPRFVKRNRDEWVAISSEHLKAAFSAFTFEAELLYEDDGSVTATIKGFDLVENGETADEAIDLLTEELVEYANEYQDNFKSYFQAPNRHDHFPYIMNVLVQDNIEGVKSLIRCPVGEK